MLEPGRRRCLKSLVARAALLFLFVSGVALEVMKSSLGDFPLRCSYLLPDVQNSAGSSSCYRPLVDEKRLQEHACTLFYKVCMDQAGYKQPPFLHCAVALLADDDLLCTAECTLTSQSNTFKTYSTHVALHGPSLSQCH